jgi:hypothetical protein
MKNLFGLVLLTLGLSGCFAAASNSATNLPNQSIDCKIQSVKSFYVASYSERSNNLMDSYLRCGDLHDTLVNFNGVENDGHGLIPGAPFSLVSCSTLKTPIIEDNNCSIATFNTCSDLNGDRVDITYILSFENQEVPSNLNGVMEFVVYSGKNTSSMLCKSDYDVTFKP